MSRRKSTIEDDGTRTSFRNFSKALHQRLREWAVLHERTMEYTLNRCVREWLDAQDRHIWDARDEEEDRNKLLEEYEQDRPTVRN